MQERVALKRKLVQGIVKEIENTLPLSLETGLHLLITITPAFKFSDYFSCATLHRLSGVDKRFYLWIHQHELPRWVEDKFFK